MTFATGYTVTGPVTLDGHYIPLVVLTFVKSVKSTLKLAVADTTDLDPAGDR